MKKSKLLFAFILLFSLFWNFHTQAALEDYSVLRDIDKGTFNEYRYYMINEYFKLKEKFELQWSVDKAIALNIMKYANTGQKYLPDNLMSQNYYNNLKIAIQKWLGTPNSEVYYGAIVTTLNDYLEKVSIKKIRWSIDVSPLSWNAPLTATFRGKVTDPTWTIIPPNNYVWWVDIAGVKKILWRGTSLNFTFKEEWNFTVFLDVKSTHKNAWWYIDVTPFSTRAVIEVKAKIASIIITVNSKSLKEYEEIKFTPDESSYWLIFDATSSLPTWWAKFNRTEWNFWNGVERKYDGSPRMERVVYSTEWNFPVSLRLTTNEWKTVERRFEIAIHKPIASISSNIEDGYIGDKFVFSAISSRTERSLSFSWNIIDINNDKILVSKEGNIINYIFTEKGRYNIQLKVKDAAWNEDVDTRIIYINSRAPICEFNFSNPDKSKPNKILFDASQSFDPDFNDDGKLKYTWTINGEIIKLDQIDTKCSVWYYTFESIGNHSVTLEVIDPD